MVLAMEWASRVTTVSLEMALPALAGYWGDQMLGTKPALVIVGAVLGLVCGMWHLLRMTRPADSKSGSPQHRDRTPPE